MTGLQTNIGLISGINYVELVNQLIAIDGRSRDALVERTDRLELERNALTDMMALFLRSSFMIRNLNNMTPFLRTELTSSNPALMTATRGIGGMPVPGSFTFTPIQKASAQQTVASGVASATEALGRTGTITLGKGWSVENESELRHLNGGNGFDRGLIRLIDGNGARATIDLRNVMTVNDIVKAINENHDVDIIAEIQDNRLVLRDVSGAATPSIIVQEVSGGTTAASLGLIGSNVSNVNGVLTGNSIWRLSENMSLSLLNDGMGLVFNNMGPDLLIICRDNTLVTVDFNRITTAQEREAGAPDTMRELTVGDLLNTINAAGNGKVTARISDDGRGIVIDDHTTGQHLTQISQPTNFDSPILRSLGLTRGNETSVDMFTGLTDANTTAKMYVENTRTGERTLIELSHEEVGLIRLAASQVPASTPFRAIRDTVNTKLEAAGLDLRLQANSTNTGYDFVGSQDLRFVNHASSDLATRLGLTGVTEPGTIVALDGVVPGKIEFTDKDGHTAIIDIRRADLDGLTSIDEVAALFNSKIQEFNDNVALPGEQVRIKVDVNATGDRLVFVDETGATSGEMSIRRIDPVSIIGSTAPRVEFQLNFSAGQGQLKFSDRDGREIVIDVNQDILDAIEASYTDPSQGAVAASLINAQIAAFNSTAPTGQQVGLTVESGTHTAGFPVLRLLGTTNGTQPLKVEAVAPVSPLAMGDVVAHHIARPLVDINGSWGTGIISIRGMDGVSFQLDITQAEVEGFTSLADYAQFLNDKIDEVNTENNLNITVQFRVNAAGTELIMEDTGNHPPGARLEFHDGTFITGSSVTVFQAELNFDANASPGRIRLVDGSGQETTISITQEDLDAMAGMSLNQVATLLNGKIAGAATPLDLEVIVNSTNDGLLLANRGLRNVYPHNIKVEMLAPVSITGRGHDTVHRLDVKVDDLDAIEAGRITLRDHRGVERHIDLSNDDVAAIKAMNGDMAEIADWFKSKLPATGTVRFNVEVNSDGTGLVFTSACDDISHFALKITADATGIFDLSSATTTQQTEMTINFAGASGQLSFRKPDGTAVNVWITQKELDDANGSLQHLADLINTKFAGMGVSGMTVSVNDDDTALVVSTSIAGDDGLLIGQGNINLLPPGGIRPELVVEIEPAAEPGMIRLTGANGRQTNITLSDNMLAAAASGDMPELARLLNEHISIFNHVFAALGTPLNLQVQATDNGRLVFSDSVGGTTPIRVEQIPVPPNNTITGRLNIEGDCGGTGTMESIVFSSVRQSGGTLQSGTFQTRSLLGGLDTVLVSSLNAGMGMHNARPGVVEVQDRAGNRALLEFSHSDLQSMQTLGDAVRVYNAKLSAAGVGITVRINDNKTGLALVDTTGSSSHNLIFRDLAETVAVPGTPAVPAIPAIDAVSGAISNVNARSGGTGGLGGVATLEFANGALLNGFTFGFSNDFNVAGLDIDGKTIFFGISDIQGVPTAERDEWIADTINAQLAFLWEHIAPEVAGTRADVPTLVERSGLANDALNDAANNRRTAIRTENGGTLGRVGGTASLTFEGTDVMNLFSFAFTTDASAAGYNSQAQRFTVLLTDEILNATTEAGRDQLVKAAIDGLIASQWTTVFPPAIFTDIGDPAKVKLTAGMGANAVNDARIGGETRISSTHGTMGRKYVPAVPEVPPTTAPGPSPNIASSFGLNVNAASSRVNGTILDRQIISHNTLLSELNGGAGVNMNTASITITGSQPNTETRFHTNRDGTPALDARGQRIPLPPNNVWNIRIDPEQIRTVGDLIDLINRSTGNHIVASINETGDGVMITDRANGPGTFSIRDTDSNSRFAETMRIAGSVTATQRAAQGTVDWRGEPVGRISMSETHRIEVEATDSLEDIRKKINDLNTNYSASILMDGTSAPFRLSISSRTTGAAGAFNIDLSALGLTTETLSRAQDAMIVYGDASVSSGLILRSSTNTFRNTVNGIDLTITGTSTTPVTITSTPSSMEVRVSLQQFVDSYNEFREFFNTETHFVANDRGIQGNILWNCQVSRAIDRDITRLLQETVRGIPGIRTLADLGITMNRSNDGSHNLDTGKLSFDEDRFNAAWERDPDAVRRFFFDERVTGRDKDGKDITENIGWAYRFSKVVDSLAGSAEVTGKLPARIDALTMSIDRNDERLNFMQERLEVRRQMYLKQFWAMEQAMARMSGDMAAVGNIMNVWQSSFNTGR